MPDPTKAGQVTLQTHRIKAKKTEQQRSSQIGMMQTAIRLVETMGDRRKDSRKQNRIA